MHGGIRFGLANRQISPRQQAMLHSAAKAVPSRFGEITMTKKIWFCIAIGCLFLGSCKKEITGGHLVTLTAYLETSGNSVPASTPTSGPASITCTLAPASGGYPASCQIAAPGYGGAPNQGQTAGSSGPGTVMLTCNGQAPKTCKANVSW